jgi:hypothetical protein
MDKTRLLKLIYQYFGSITDDLDTRGKKELIREAKADSKTTEEKDSLVLEISQVLEGYPVLGWVDDESCCYEFIVLLHKNQDILDNDIQLIKELGNTRYDLELFISVLGPYIYSSVYETKHHDDGSWSFLTLRHYSEEIDSAVKKINEHFKSNGYQIIPYDLACEIIPDIQSKYKDYGGFTVFNGLFTDLYYLKIFNAKTLENGLRSNLPE